MATASELLSLHSYYLRASLMYELMRHFAPGSRPTIGRQDDIARSIPEPALALVNLLDAANALSVFYATVFVLAEGFKELDLSDPAVDPLLRSENFDLLRRFRNAMFHYQSDFHESAKVLQLLTKPGSEDWVKELWNALRRWCSQNLQRLVEEHLQQEKPPA
jgi:hypothetical protein